MMPPSVHFIPSGECTVKKKKKTFRGEVWGGGEKERTTVEDWGQYSCDNWN